jgi:propionyl-CoA carboxylase alpha chain
MISKILVANRGEIARRVFRTCRELGIATVAVYSDPDRDEPHALEADEAVALPGSSPTETYLDIASILSAAKATGADAIHPGYGFLSENPDFAAAVVANGLTWIGPDPETIERMGSKVRAKRIMEEAGVPVLPSMELAGSSTLESAGLAMGFPVLVKASMGGGGKGMRLVHTREELLEAVHAAEGEALRSFGDGTVFLERYLDAARHIEAQIFGDRRGNVVFLHERECSIQRRHQKIIEEAPSPALDQASRDRLGAIAVDAGRAVGYVGAGTVEFLYQDDRFHFLEMNTRLQVEHPVTEMITGLDLVRLQIEVADGGAVPDVPPISGHAVEARLYAEDPSTFLPTSGRFDRFEFDPAPGIRVDSGVETGSEVSIHYDPMVAKVVAHGATRETAIAHLVAALRGARLHGPTTNRALLIGVLEHPEFAAGMTDIRFLERNEPAQLTSAAAAGNLESIAAMAAALSDQAEVRSSARVLTSLPSGWRNSPGVLHRRGYLGAEGPHDVGYRMTRAGVALDGEHAPVVVDLSPDSVTLAIDGIETEFRISRYDRIRWVDSALGSARLEESPRFDESGPEEVKGSLHAPMPGVILRVDIGVGDQVTEGQVLMVLEAMKMEHSLRAPHSGTVAEIRHLQGDQVSGGETLIVIEGA